MAPSETTRFPVAALLRRPVEDDAPVVWLSVDLTGVPEAERDTLAAAVRDLVDRAGGAVTMARLVPR